jgi:hypothetical protein
MYHVILKPTDTDQWFEIDTDHFTLIPLPITLPDQLDLINPTHTTEGTSIVALYISVETKYDVKVKAKNKAGWGKYSHTVTSDIPNLDVSVTLHAKAVTESSIDLNWKLNYRLAFLSHQVYGRVEGAEKWEAVDWKKTRLTSM